MSDDDMTSVPTALIEALRDDTTTFDRISIPAMGAIIACLPKPAPTFSDEVCEAFFEAVQVRGRYSDSIAGVARSMLIALYGSGWLTPTDDESFIITPPKEPTDA